MGLREITNPLGPRAMNDIILVLAPMDLPLGADLNETLNMILGPAYLLWDRVPSSYLRRPALRIVSG